MGNYVNNHLIAHEHVQYEARPHWIIFVSWPALFSLFILPLVDYLTSEYVITNRRVIVKVGLIARSTLEMNLLKIESVNVDQSILGRILNYGSITIIGTGGTRETFHGISSPMVFRQRFQELV